MKKMFLCIVFACLLFNTTSATSIIPPAGHVLQEDERDGSSYEKAIIIEETTEAKGVPAEYKWLRQHYPGHKVLKQSLSPYKGRYYDILLIKYKGKKKSVYFDITNFFGKF